MNPSLIIRKRCVAAAGLAGLLLLAGCGRSGEENLEAGIVRLGEGQNEAAAEFLEKAVRQMPDNASAWCNLGIACLRLDRKEKAVLFFQKAADLDAYDPRPLEFLAQAYGALKKWDAARDALVRADKRAPALPRILTALAVLDLRAGKADVAQALLLRALDVDADYAPALYNLAVLQRDKLKNPEAALATYKRFLAAAGGDPRAKTLNEFLNPAPSPGPVPAGPKAPGPGVLPSGATAASERLVALALAAANKGENDKALELLKQAAKQNPSDPAPVWEMAQLYDKAGLADKAADTYRRFVQQFPQDPRCAKIGKRADDKTKPKPADRKAGQENPAEGATAAQEAFREGFKYHQAGSVDTAITYYMRAVELDPSLARGHYNLGLALKAKGRLKDAREAFLRALAIEPNMVKGRYMLAVVCRQTDDKLRAKEELRKALAIDPKYAQAYLLLGMIAKDENNIPEAKAAFARFVKLAPDDPSAPMVKEWLDSP